MASIVESVASGIAHIVMSNMEHIRDRDVGEQLCSVFIPDQKEQRDSNIPQESWNQLVKKEDLEFGEKMCIILIPEEKEECTLHIPQDVDSLKPEVAICMDNIEVSEDSSRSQDADNLKPDVVIWIDNMEVSEDNSHFQYIYKIEENDNTSDNSSDDDTVNSSDSDNDSIELNQIMNAVDSVEEWSVSQPMRDEEISKVGGDVADCKNSPLTFEIYKDVVVDDISKNADTPKSEFSVYIDIEESKENACSQVGGAVANGKSCCNLFGIQEIENLFLHDIPIDKDEEGGMSENTVARIWKRIKVEFDTFLLCWTPLESVPPDFIETVLGRHQSKTIRNRWVRTSGGSQSAVFGGLIADFPDESSLHNAAKELFLLSGAVQTIQLDNLLRLFSLEEAIIGEGPTSILVSGKKLPSCEREVDEYIAMLQSFGRVLTVFFYNAKDRVLVPIVRAKFAFATQAYAAKFYLDGYPYGLAGRLRVDVQEGTREQEICRNVKSSLVEFLDEGWRLRKCSSS